MPANRLLALLQQRSIRENIALPAFGGLLSWGPIGMRAERARVDSAIERLQIDTRASSELRRLSGGNQQKVVIARWLASGFNTLLCFDPTRGIDIGTKRQIYALGSGTRGGWVGGVAVHFRASRDRARLRSRDRPVRRARGRGDAGRRSRRGHAVARRAWARPAIAGGVMTRPPEANRSAIAVPAVASTAPFGGAAPALDPASPEPVRDAGAADRLARVHRRHSSAVFRFRPAIAGDGSSAARLRRGRADGGRDLGRDRSFDRVGDGGRQRAGGEHHGERELRPIACCWRWWSSSPAPRSAR